MMEAEMVTQTSGIGTNPGAASQHTWSRQHRSKAQAIKVWQRIKERQQLKAQLDAEDKAKHVSPAKGKKRSGSPLVTTQMTVVAPATTADGQPPNMIPPDDGNALSQMDGGGHLKDRIDGGSQTSGPAPRSTIVKSTNTAPRDLRITVTMSDDEDGGSPWMSRISNGRPTLVVEESTVPAILTPRASQPVDWAMMENYSNSVVDYNRTSTNRHDQGHEHGDGHHQPYHRIEASSSDSSASASIPPHISTTNEAPHSTMQGRGAYQQDKVSNNENAHPNINGNRDATKQQGKANQGFAAHSSSPMQNQNQDQHEPMVARTQHSSTMDRPKSSLDDALGFSDFQPVNESQLETTQASIHDSRFEHPHSQRAGGDVPDDASASLIDYNGSFMTRSFLAPIQDDSHDMQEYANGHQIFRSDPNTPNHNVSNGDVGTKSTGGHSDEPSPDSALLSFPEEDSENQSASVWHQPSTQEHHRSHGHASAQNSFMNHSHHYDNQNSLLHRSIISSDDRNYGSDNDDTLASDIIHRAIEDVVQQNSFTRYECDGNENDNGDHSFFGVGNDKQAELGHPLDNQSTFDNVTNPSAGNGNANANAYHSHNRNTNESVADRRSRDDSNVTGTDTQLSLASLQDSRSVAVEDFRAERRIANQLAITGPLDASNAADDHQNRQLQLVAKPAASDGDGDIHGKELEYMTRIGALESTLKAQNMASDTVQSQLQAKVEQLQTALHHQRTTPRASAHVGMPDDPITTLLERNKNLVKEVRFSDQTCMELSTQNTALQAQIEILKDQLQVTQHNQDNWQLEGQDDRRIDGKLDRLRITNGSGNGRGNANEDTHSSWDESRAEEPSRQAQTTMSAQAIEEKDAEIRRLSTELQHARTTINRIKENSVDGATIKDVLNEIQMELGAIAQGNHVLETKPTTDTSTSQDANSNIERRWGLNDGVEEKKDESFASIKVSKTFDSQDSYNLAEELQQQVQLLRSKTQRAEADSKRLRLQLQASRDENDKLKTEMREEIDSDRSESAHLQRRLSDVQVELHDVKSSLESERRNLHHVQNLYEKQLAATASKQHQPSEYKVLELQQELADARSSLVSMKRQSEELIRERSSNPSNQVQNEAHAAHQQDQRAVAEILRNGLQRIMQQYQRLDQQVKDVTDCYATRLERLVEAVAFLRSSLHFESDSVSTQVQDRGDRPSTSVSHRMMDATIDANAPSMNREEDTRLELMEEARPSFELSVDDGRDPKDSPHRVAFAPSTSTPTSTRLSTSPSSLSTHAMLSPMNANTSRPTMPPNQDDCFEDDSCLNQSDSLDSISRLLNEPTCDVNGSIMTTMTTNTTAIADQYRIPLEAALKECQQVRNRLMELQSSYDEERKKLLSDIEEQTATYRDLEAENARLCLASSRQAAEKTQLQTELEDKMGTVRFLESRLEDTESARQASVKDGLEKDSALSQLKQEKVLCESMLGDAIRNNETLEGRIEVAVTEQSKLSEVVAEKAMEVRALQSKQQDLLVTFKNQQMDLEKQKTAEIELLRTTLSQAEAEVEGLRASYNTTAGRLSEASQHITELRAEMEQVEDDKQRIISSTEDQVLEIEMKLDEAQRDRTDLKLKLSRVEEELKLTSKSYSDLKSKATQQLHEAQMKINEIITERDEVLSAEAKKLTEVQASYHVQLKQEQEQTAKLLSLLQQAEEEMNRSAGQIQQLSQATQILQSEQEQAHKHIGTLESQLHGSRTEKETLQHEHSAVQEMLERTRSELSLTKRALSSAGQELAEHRCELESKNGALQKLEEKIGGLDAKCSRLREYIKKLSSKCDEWEASYKRQAQVIVQLRQKNGKTKEKASKLADRYKQLAGDVERKNHRHHQDRAKWNAERCNLQSVHTQLEEELSTIAKDLTHFEAQMQHR